MRCSSVYVDLPTLSNRRHVQQAQEQINQAHMDYCGAAHPDIQVRPLDTGGSTDGILDEAIGVLLI